MNQPTKKGSDATFNTLLFAGLLIGGAVAGGKMATHVIIDSHTAAFAGAAMMPLGVILGLAFGQGTAPTTAVLNLFAVFDGRLTVEQIIGRGGGTGGVLYLAFAITAGCVALALATAFGIDVFVKPEASFGTIATWFGGCAAIFGAVTGALIVFISG